MDDSQLTPGYQKNAPECKIDFYLPVRSLYKYYVAVYIMVIFINGLVVSIGQAPIKNLLLK